MTFSDWQRAFLDATRVGRLGTVARDGRPHIVPVCYALWEGTIVIAIDEKPKRGTELARLRNIRQDPRVSLLVDVYSDEWEQLAWVRLDGTAEIVTRGDQLPGALAALRERYPQYNQMDLEARPMIVIRPARVVEWQWTEGATRDPSRRTR